MAFERIELNLIPDGEMPVFHCSQFDAGRPVIIDLMVGDDAYTPSAGVTFELHCRKVDDNIVTLDTYEVDENTVTFASTEQLCACVGDNLCEISILLDDLVLGTLNFILHVEPDPLAGGLTSETSIHNLTDQVREITEEVIGDDYYNKTEVDDLLDDKADKSTTYTKTEVDTELNLKADKSTTYTKTETDTLLNDKADKSTTYTKTQVDDALALKANSADLAAVATTGDYDDLLNKPSIPAAQVQSDYEQSDNTKVDYIKNKPDLSIYATQEEVILATGTEDETPYLFRAKPNSVGNRCIDKLVGGTVAFNQLVEDEGSFTILSGGSQSHEFNPYSDIITGHKYLCLITQDITLTSVTRNRFFYRVGSTHYATTDYLTKGQHAWIFSAEESGSGRFGIWVVDPNADVTYSNYMVIDLTAFFGSTIADYIYSLEQGTAGAGVAWLKAYAPQIFGKYNAYNAGQLMSVKTSKHSTTGFNQWDEEWELGTINVYTGENVDGSSNIRSKNYISVLPNTTYYFNRNNIAGNIFEYDENHDFIRLQGSPTTFTTSANCRYVRFYMGSGYGTTYNHDICINLSWDGERNGEYEPYVKHEYDLSGSRLVHRVFGYRDYESGDESLADAITDGTHTVYKLATPFDETVSNPELRGILKLDNNNKLYYYGDTCDDFTNPQIVDDFGTEEYVDTREVPIPVGHDTIYSKKTNYRYW